MIATKQLEDMFQTQLTTLCVNIELEMQEQYEQVVTELRLRYPKRKIEMRFGMGAVFASGFENTQYSDNYGNLHCKDQMWNGTYDTLPEGHPLKRLVDLMGMCYPHNGNAVCCDDILMED